MWENVGHCSVSLDCKDTSRLLFPVAHCCDDAGLGLHASPSPTTKASPSPTTKETPYGKSSPKSDGGAVTGAVAGVVIFILLGTLAGVGVVLFLVLSSKRQRWKKWKKLERMQLDILAM